MKPLIDLWNDVKEWVDNFFWEYYPDSTYGFKSKNFILLIMFLSIIGIIIYLNKT